jgi:hypothetical protein
MIVIPRYGMVLIPILNIWWTHRRAERREYKILVVSFLSLFGPLLILAYYRRCVCTRYDAPLSASGINTLQIPLSLLVTTLITMLPVKMKLVRNFIAFLVGESLLLDTWIS